MYQSVNITKYYRHDIIFVGDNNGHNGASNSFNVEFGQLNSFNCDSIPLNQHEGFPFHFYCTAYDEYGNVKEDYNKDVTSDTIQGKVNISDEHNCFAKMSGNFENGYADIVVRALSGCTTDKLFLNDNDTVPVVSVVSNTYNVRNDDIYFEISLIGNQVKGTPFDFYVTVKDASGYLYTDFDGALEIKDLTGRVYPTVSSNFTNGELTQNIKINATSSADKIILTNYSDLVTQSNSFVVEGPPLSYFTADNVDSRQLVNYSFPVKFYAYDVNNDIKTDFNKTVSMNDLTGTLQPQQITFYNGIATSEVTISSIRPNKDDNITITYGNFTTSTNNFSVEERKLDHFEISSIPDQRQYIVFYVNIYAKDLKGNTFENFHNPVTISDYTGTVTPVTSNSFVNGILENQKLRIDQLANGDKITVYYHDGNRLLKGQSNIFNVLNSSVRQITFDNIPDQTKNIPFDIHMKALNANGDVVEGFEGKVQLAYYINLNNVIHPTESRYFTIGEDIEPVYISEATPVNFLGIKVPVAIIATLPGVGIFGSNTFIVNEP